jgi:hypothetical protein
MVGNKTLFQSEWGNVQMVNTLQQVMNELAGIPAEEKASVLLSVVRMNETAVRIRNIIDAADLTAGQRATVLRMAREVVKSEVPTDGE